MNIKSANSGKILSRGWKSIVDDYAISGGWTYNGELLIVCDAVGGIYVFNGKSGEKIWASKEVHVGGILSSSIHPSKDIFLTGGQDGKVLIWDIYQKKKKLLTLVIPG